MSVQSSGLGAVYDLTVEGEHEFFAGGILVHNCHHVRYSQREEGIPTDRFDLLEEQLCSFVPGVTEKSPDRMDALVWAITELVIDPDIEYTGQFSEPVSISPI